MRSMKDELKGFDLELIKRKAEEAKASSITSTSEDGGTQTNQNEYNCHLCKDEGGTFVKRPVQQVVHNEVFEFMVDHWKICGCVEASKIERLMKASHITEEFQKKNFRNFDQDRPQIVIDAYNCAYNYVLKFKEIRAKRQNSVALLGRPGCGKTHLIMAIANNLIKKGTAVTYFPYVEGFNELKEDLSQVSERVFRLQQVEVLYIDDLFKGRDELTPFQKEQLFAIINYRYLQNKPMLISSEKSVSEMCQIDEAIGSRIYEMCKDYSVTLNGGIELNYRLK